MHLVSCCEYHVVEQCSAFHFALFRHLCEHIWLSALNNRMTAMYMGEIEMTRIQHAREYIYIYIIIVLQFVSGIFMYLLDVKCFALMQALKEVLTADKLGLILVPSACPKAGVI